jgi:hypothetical protein
MLHTGPITTIRDIANKPFEKTLGDGHICWIARRLLPRRDKYGGCQWECQCSTCGQLTIIRSYHLKNLWLPPCPNCGPRLRTIAEVEASGTHVSANNSEYANDNKEYPWLIRQFRKFDMFTSDDYFQEHVADWKIGPVTFYSRAAITRCNKEWNGIRSTNLKSRWKNDETIPRRGEEWVRGSYVQRELGISETMREYWDANGWPILHGNRPRSIQANGFIYYAKAQVDGELKSKLEALPSGIPTDHPSLFSEEKTSQLTDLSVDILRHKDFRERHLGLVTEHFLARIDETWLGEPRKRCMWLTGYTKSSVRDFLERRDGCILPARTISLQDLVCRLRKSLRCKVTAGTLIKWCREKLLDSQLEAYLTETGVRTGWIVAEESAASAKIVLRECGWETHAATIKMRELHHQRVAEKNGQPLRSLVAERIAEQRLLARRLAEQRLLAELLNAPTSAAEGDHGLVAGRYFYVVTAITDAGESPISNEQSISFAATSQVTLAWSEVPRATGYNVYRSLMSGIYTNAVKVATKIPTTTITDTGAFAVHATTAPIAPIDLNGHGDPIADAAPHAGPETPSDTPQKNGRGRRKGWRNAETQRRKKEMLDAWESGTHGDNKAAAAAAHGFDRSNGTKIINEHERKKHQN